MSINIISALSKNKVIGNKGTIPWRIPKDLKYFKNKTTSGDSRNALIMGRKTWESLPTYPSPLADRSSYVITKNNAHRIRATLTFPEMPTDKDIAMIQKRHPNIWICGGQSVYEYFINKPYIDKLYLTEIDFEIEGDTYFPEIPPHFIKTIQGKDYKMKENALNYVKYNFTMYSNLSYPRWSSHSVYKS